MNIYGITDSHFGHKMFDGKIGGKRPPDYSVKILASIKSLTGDMLIHTGDFCFGKDAEWIAKYVEAAKGFKQIVLVRGNHDGKSDSYYLKHGFTFVAEAIRMKIDKKVVLFTHMPVGFDRATERDFWQPTWPFDVNVHGHYHGSHGSIYDDSRYYDLAPESNDCQAVNINKLVTRYESRGYKYDRSKDKMDGRIEANV